MSNAPQQNPVLYFLSGAPRVSTNPAAEASGARSHILGVIRGFESVGWSVERYIVGDMVPVSWTGAGSRNAASRSYLRRLAADLIRMTMARANSIRAAREIQGTPELVYERFGAFQALGRALQRRGVPWVLETNAPLFLESQVERKSMALTGLARRMEVKAYRDCDVLVCVSNELKEIVIEEARIDDRKVVVLPNGVDADFFNPTNFQPIRLFRDFTVGFVGNLYPGAGIDLLLHAIHDLRADGMPVSAVIVGDGVMRTQWEESANAIGVAEHVKFTGQLLRNDVPPYVLGFDVGYSGQTLVNMGGTGRMYRSPLKIYEYMAMAKPVVASAYDDARSVLVDGRTGFLFEPGSLEGLKRALTDAFQLRPALHDLGALARNEVVSNHSWQSRVRFLLSQVKQILEQR